MQIEKSRRQLTERWIKRGFFTIALASITVLFLISLFLILEGVPIFEQVSVKDFLFGQYWSPTREPPDFGIFPMIVGSISVTALSGIMAIPLGIMTAIYLAEIAGPRIREWIKPVVELLAALPSVVIGFFGMVVVAPFLQDKFDIPTGLNMFNASLMLAFMSIPTICSLSEDAIYSVPGNLKEASLALGATHWDTIVKVILPASTSGISTAVILGMSRAIGETMVVLMVAGNSIQIPGSIFDSVRPLPASIAAEVLEAQTGGNHYHALFATGIVLFIFTLMFNLLADHIANRYRQVGDATL
jgi:phosphate transport system permease protein